MRELSALFAALSQSAFRKKFHLQGKDLEYLQNKGLATVISHADDFISKRLAPALPEKDGKQTPFRGHPVFVAQHATACCCRACLSQWHHIPQGRPLSVAEKTYILTALERWLLEELQANGIDF